MQYKEGSIKLDAQRARMTIEEELIQLRTFKQAVRETVEQATVDDSKHPKRRDAAGRVCVRQTHRAIVNRLRRFIWTDGPIEYNEARGIWESVMLGHNIIRQVPADQFYHIKINSSEYEKRGRSELFCVLGWLKTRCHLFDEIETDAKNQTLGGDIIAEPEPEPSDDPMDRLPEPAKY